MEKISILPRDINLEPRSKHVHVFASVFGKHEMNVVAEVIVRHLAKQNKWRPILFSEIFFVGRDEQGERELTVIDGWELLLDYGWIDHYEGSKFKLKDSFIKRCKKESDALCAQAK